MLDLFISVILQGFDYHAGISNKDQIINLLINKRSISSIELVIHNTRVPSSDLSLPIL